VSRYAWDTFSRPKRQRGGLARYFGRTRHYNDEGNALVAEFVYAGLERGVASTDRSFHWPVPERVGIRQRVPLDQAKWLLTSTTA